MKITLRWTIIIGCIALVWGTHIIVAPSSYFMTKQVLTKHMQDIMVNISDLTLEQANNHLNKAKSAASLAKQLLTSNVVSSDIDGSSSLERYFFDQLSIYPHLSGIYVAGMNGNFLMVSKHNKHQPDGFRTKVIHHNKGVRATELTWRSPSYKLIASKNDPTDTYDPRSRPWFVKAKQHDHIVWSDPYIFYTAQKPGVTIAGTSHDKQGTLKTIVGVDIEIAELSTFISKLRVGKSGKAFILHRNGDVIAYQDINKLIVSEPDGSDMRLPKINELKDIIVQKAFNSINWQHDNTGHLIINKAHSAVFNHLGNKYLSMFTPFPETELPWIIGVYIPENDYLAEIKNSQLFNLVITLVISILASILGLLVANKIITPVVQLADGAKRIESHDITAPFHLQTVFREIQDTADSFAKMKTALLDYEKKLHDNEKIYRAITNTANDAIILLNFDHEITYLNPAAEKMFGFQSQEVIGQKFYNTMIPEKEIGKYQHGITMFMQDEGGIFKERTVQVTAQARDGLQIPIELSLSKLKQNDRLYCVAVIRNISERIKAAQLRKRLVNDLHDGLGGTLSNIKLLAEITKGHHAIPEQTLRNLNAITENSEDCILEIQNYINVLDSPGLSWKDFIAELHRYSAKTLEVHSINFTTNVDLNNDTDYPTTLLYMNIFKITKEALHNVIKHSNADTVTLKISVTDKHVEWVFKDNGSIIDSPSDSKIGLLSMDSRVKELGGTIAFKNENGFYISITIPFSNTTVHHRILTDDSAKD